MLPQQVLLACSDADNSHALVNIVRQAALEPVLARSVREAHTILATAAIALTFCEDHLPEGGYRKLLHKPMPSGNCAPLVVVSRLGDAEQYREAMQAGALDYITPPYGQAEIESIINRRCEKRVEITLPVQVYGAGANGLPFLQGAHTRNISSQGALLEVIACDLKPGIVIGVRCCDKEANFRVVWVRDTHGSPKAQEVGIQSLQPTNFIWSLLRTPGWESEGNLAARSDHARLVDSHIVYDIWT